MLSIFFYTLSLILDSSVPLYLALIEVGTQLSSHEHGDITMLEVFSLIGHFREQAPN